MSGCCNQYPARFLPVEQLVTSIADMPPQLQAFVANPLEAQLLSASSDRSMFDIATRLIKNPYNGTLAS